MKKEHCMSVGVILLLLSCVGVTCTFNCYFDRSLNLNVSALVINFYDNKHDVALKIPIDGASNRLFDLGLDTSRRLVLFMPGYRSLVKGQTGDWMREAFENNDAYLIIVDYSPYTGVLTKENYEKSVTYTYYIGAAVGRFLAGLHSRGYPSKSIVCVGHSFGGPILGYTAEAYISETSEKLGRVTAVESAKPCFEGAENRVRSGIADCVDVIHCTNGRRSVNGTLADLDVFLNADLRFQPDCYDGYYLKALGRVDADTCGHVICFKYWTRTVLDTNSYAACRSPDMRERRCGNFTLVGYHGTCSVRGVLYASTEMLVSHTGNDTFVTL